MEQARKNPASQDPVALDYAPRKAWHRRSHLLRWVVLICLISLCIAGQSGIRRYWSHLKTMLAQRSCLRYSAPVDRVVYETTADLARRDLAQSAEYFQIPNALEAECVVGFMPRQWETFCSHFYTVTFPRSSGCLFLGKRINRNGQERLVAIDAIATFDGGSDSRPLSFSARVFTIASLFHKPSEVTRPAVNVIELGNPPLDCRFTRIFAGQSDTSNQSHFNIRFESEGNPGIIDGYLHNDDSVTLEVRRPEAGAK